MTNKGLKEADIFKAAYELEKRSIKVTAKSIRDLLGSGSMTTISKHLKNWGSAKESYFEENVKVDLKQLLIGIDDNILSEYLQNELPQIIALILSHTDSSRAAKILSKMNSKLREKVIFKIENMSPIRCEIVELVAMTIQSEINSLIVIQDHQLGGKSFADSIKKQIAS